jgi:hypothetical protein
MRRSSVAVFALLLCACDFGTLDDLSQDEAVEGADELTSQARTLWAVYDHAKYSNGDVKKAVAGLEGVVGRAGSLPVQVKLDALTKQDLALVGMGDKDPNAAQGMLLISELDCSLEQVEKLVVAKNQTDIYPGLYDSYTRTYVTSVDAFLTRAEPTVTWKTSYQATALDRTYQSVLTGGARFVPSAMPGGAPVLMARTVLDEPAKFIKGADSGFAQDYQLEVYYARGPQKTLHFYALWRDFHVSTLASSSDLYVNVVLGNLSDFDVRTSKVCREGKPAPTFQ